MVHAADAGINLAIADLSIAALLRGEPLRPSAALGGRIQQPSPSAPRYGPRRAPARWADTIRHWRQRGKILDDHARIEQRAAVSMKKGPEAIASWMRVLGPPNIASPDVFQKFIGIRFETCVRKGWSAMRSSGCSWTRCALKTEGNQYIDGAAAGNSNTVIARA